MSKFVELGRLLLAEAWYQALRWAPLGVGSLGMGTCMLWNGTAMQKASVATLATGTMLWQRVWKDTTCLSLTPTVRSSCKSYCASCLKDAEDVKVFEGFTQCVTRLLFEPKDEFWTQRERVEVQTVLQDGSIESRGWLRQGKGIFAFPRPTDLDQNITAQSPYSFCREDASTASVRMWTKTVDEGLKSAFNMQAINASDLNDPQERIAYTDFTQALVNLLGPEALQQGIIWKCVEKKQTVRTHLAIEGKLTSVIKVLKEHPLTARHYFRCFASDENGVPALHANLGFGLAHLDLFPGKTDENIVLYIRQGTKEHGCTQSSKVFALDNRLRIQ